MSFSKYTLLSDSSDCCRQWPRQMGDSRGIVLHIARGANLSACADMCMSAAHCRFFSYARKFRSCSLCSSCELATEPGLGDAYASWSLTPLHSYRPLKALPSDLLIENLQGQYSRLLYGQSGLVPRDLRIIWLPLVNRTTSAWSFIQRTLICRFSPVAPHSPLYSPIDAAGAK